MTTSSTCNPGSSFVNVKEEMNAKIKKIDFPHFFGFRSFCMEIVTEENSKNTENGRLLNDKELHGIVVDLLVSFKQGNKSNQEVLLEKLIVTNSFFFFIIF